MRSRPGCWARGSKRKELWPEGSFHLLCTSGHKPPAALLPTCQEHVRDVASRTNSAQPGTSILRLLQTQVQTPHTYSVISLPASLQGQDPLPGQGLRVPTKPGLSPGSDTWAGQQVRRAKRPGREPDILGEFLAQQPTLLSSGSWSRAVGVVKEVKRKTRADGQLPGQSVREEELRLTCAPPLNTQHANLYVVLRKAGQQVSNTPCPTLHESPTLCQEQIKM